MDYNRTCVNIVERKKERRKILVTDVWMLSASQSVCNFRVKVC